MINKLQLIKIIRHGDHRGYFAETYSRREYLKLGITWILSKTITLFLEVGTLRGLHFQAPPH